MSSEALKQLIERMVGDSIRRILPTIMNEVLIRSLVSSGALGEAPRQRKPGKSGKKSQKRQVRSSPIAERRIARPAKRSEPTDLRELLDESAGAEFYEDPSAVEVQFEDEVVENRPQRDRIKNLAPALRGLAEGVAPIDDPDEMWGPDEHDSGTVQSALPGEVRNIDRAADEIGIDFSRMAQVAKKGVPTVKESAADRHAKAQFEAQRIERMRERLQNKPVG